MHLTFRFLKKSYINLEKNIIVQNLHRKYTALSWSKAAVVVNLFGPATDPLLYNFKLAISPLSRPLLLSWTSVQTMLYQICQLLSLSILVYLRLCPISLKQRFFFSFSPITGSPDLLSNANLKVGKRSYREVFTSPYGNFHLSRVASVYRTSWYNINCNHSYKLCSRHTNLNSGLTQERHHEVPNFSSMHITDKCTLIEWRIILWNFLIYIFSLKSVTILQYNHKFTSLTLEGIVLSQPHLKTKPAMDIHVLTKHYNIKQGLCTSAVLVYNYI